MKQLFGIDEIKKMKEQAKAKVAETQTKKRERVTKVTDKQMNVFIAWKKVTNGDTTKYSMPIARKIQEFHPEYSIKTIHTYLFRFVKGIVPVEKIESALKD
ncbi:MAG TPA: hypothetical protein VMX17_16760 [Candidatus Glassbacteria bacterium]|nr:hypothetical protein [Candidatus Glassbacteria bacterium]